MAYPLKTYDDLLDLIKASGRSFDLEQIERAYQVASEAHKEQKRKSGEPYILRILLPQLAFWWNWVWIPLAWLQGYFMMW